MISFEEAQQRLRELEARPRRRTVPLAEAAGRVCAERVSMDRDQPGFDRATMDGYALRWVAGQDRYRVRAEVRAGTVFDGSLEPGEGVRIMTGAPCPPDTEEVIYDQDNMEDFLLYTSGVGVSRRPDREASLRLVSELNHEHIGFIASLYKFLSRAILIHERRILRYYN